MVDNVGQQMPPIKVAFVLEGKLVDILHTDERLSAIFLSNPLVINVTEPVDAQDGNVVVGADYNYETREFTAPVTEVQEDNV